MANDTDDIALTSAIIGMDHLTGEVAVVAAPDEDRRRDKYPQVFGACDPYWSDNSDSVLRGELLVHIWHAVVIHGLNPSKIHDALLAIPEYRALMPFDSIPKRYRK